MAIEKTDADPLGWHGSRRDVLYVATGLLGAAGMAGALWPLIDSMNPDADTIARHFRFADLRSFEVGQRKTIEYFRWPVFICRRTPEEIAAARSALVVDLKDPQTDGERVQQAEWLVVIGRCTFRRCALWGQEPTERRGKWGGWACHCCGSSYDTSGRIRRGPAPKNLELVPHIFQPDGSLLIAFAAICPTLTLYRRETRAQVYDRAPGPPWYPYLGAPVPVRGMAHTDNPLSAATC